MGALQDFYELFEHGNRLKAPLLVRASKDRSINKYGAYDFGKFEKLWVYRTNEWNRKACTEAGLRV